ncbi:MAG: peptide chain release factor N(5)-glutamine methyltransferase [Microthrixaceae bacterium]
MEPGTVTWRELLAEATDRLRRHGSATDPRRIVEEASGAEGAELALVLDDAVTEGGVARFDSMVARRAEGEPLQYVLGHWGFRDLDLMVDERVLIPRPETEQVVEVALRELDRLGGRELPTKVVDLGTGSGAIALAIASERVRTSVWATDKSADAVAVARANLVGLGRPAARVSICEGDWFEALPVDLAAEVHLIVTNPPYVPEAESLPAEVVDWEPAGALRSGADGLDDIRRILSEAPRWLEREGAVVCELSPEQADAAAALAVARFNEVEVAPDLAGRPRALVARGPRP